MQLRLVFCCLLLTTRFPAVQLAQTSIELRNNHFPTLLASALKCDVTLCLGGIFLNSCANSVVNTRSTLCAIIPQYYTTPSRI